VQAAVDDVHLFTKDFAVKDITLDPLLIELLKLPDIKTFIKELCEKQDLKVIWILTESNHSITCYCKDKKAVQDFSDVLSHNLEKKTFLSEALINSIPSSVIVTCMSGICLDRCVLKLNFFNICSF
jgi:hypothetical protein